MLGLRGLENGAYPEECDDPEGPPERIPTAQERSEQLNLEPSPEGVVCAVLGHATSIRRSADTRWRGAPYPHISGPINQRN